jgi:hypothetical protein
VTTVADFEVELGVVVVVVVEAGVPEDPDAVADDVPELVVGVVCDVPDEVEVPGEVVPAVADVPGISLDTTSPSAAVAPAATIMTAFEVRRTRALATSRRFAPGSLDLTLVSPGPTLGPVGSSLDGSRLTLMGGMSPRRPRRTLTAG